MIFIITLAHAGHNHHEVAADNTSSVIMIGAIVGLAVIAAVLLIVLNFRKSPAPQPVDESEATSNE